MIESKDNNKIKLVKALSQRKIRDEHSMYLIENVKLIKEALKENIEFSYALIDEKLLEKNEISEIIEIFENTSVDYYVVKNSIFKGITDTVVSQGIIAVAKKKLYDKTQIIAKNNFIVLCDKIQDPGNLGTIIRTADAFSPAAVVVSKGCVDIYNPKVVRAAAGALYRAQVIEENNIVELISYLRAEGFVIASTVVDSNISFDDIDKSNKICLVIGNEGNGVSDDIKNSSDVCITIKMSGKTESLNASIAAGICIYEMKKKLL